MHTISISEGQKNLNQLRENIILKQEPVILTHDEGDLVLLSKEEWESNNETLNLLRDKETLKALLQSFEDHDAGKTKGESMEEVFSDLMT